MAPAHNPKVAGANPAPALEKGPAKQALFCASVRFVPVPVDSIGTYFLRRPDDAADASDSTEARRSPPFSLIAAADSLGSVRKMELTQIEWEAVEKAAHETDVEAAAMARTLLLDPDATAAALENLAERGLMDRGEDDVFRLTAAGRSLQSEHQARLNDAVRRATPTWQGR
jgi:hypothetical protein